MIFFAKERSQVQVGPLRSKCFFHFARRQPEREKSKPQEQNIQARRWQSLKVCGINAVIISTHTTNLMN